MQKTREIRDVLPPRAQYWYQTLPHTSATTLLHTPEGKHYKLYGASAKHVYDAWLSVSWGTTLTPNLGTLVVLCMFWCGNTVNYEGGSRHATQYYIIFHHLDHTTLKQSNFLRVTTLKVAYQWQPYWSAEHETPTLSHLLSNLSAKNIKNLASHLSSSIEKDQPEVRRDRGSVQQLERLLWLPSVNSACSLVWW